MIIFVYEFTGAASSIGTFHDSLQTEGWSILTAIIDDLRSISEIEVVSILNRDLRSKNPDSRFVLIDARDEESTFRKLAEKADFTIVIAPEFDDILARRCEWVEQEGGRLLGPSISSVRLTADKYALGQHLKQRGIPTPDCWLVNQTQQVESMPSTLPAVVKPRFGAGSVETHLVRDTEGWTWLTEMAGSQLWPREMIVQPFVLGQPASVAFLLGPNCRIALPAASQIFSDDGRFHYRGGMAPLRGDLTLRAQRLATRAIEAVQGLRGYVGVDLVLGPAMDGSEDWVIEINPRLTTSYIGLRALAESNLAQALIDIVIGKEVKPLKWRKGQVQFACDGRVSFKT
jgi:predicted ATP-grasp superfamily ATP-dependent carboligase